MWSEGMDTSPQLSLSMSSCIRETCASPEQLHPISWWKALTCVSTSIATIPVVFPFHFSRGVQQPSYILFLSSSISDCWRLKFCLFDFLTILWVPYLQIRSLSRQQTFPFPNLSYAEAIRLVKACGSDIELEGILQCKFEIPLLWKTSQVSCNECKQWVYYDGEKPGSWKQDFLEALMRRTFLFSGERIGLCC